MYCFKPKIENVPDGDWYVFFVKNTQNFLTNTSPGTALSAETRPPEKGTA